MPVPAHATDWIDPTRSELTLKKGQVEPGADAEALLWETTVTDGTPGDPWDCIFEHHVRVKIYTAAGAEAFSHQRIRYPRSATISELRARTVAPGGAVSVLADDAVFTTTEEKTSREELKVTSFAIPNVTPGCIVEFSYRIDRPGRSIRYLESPLQLDIPVVLRRVRVRPRHLFEDAFREIALNVSADPLERDREGYYVTAAHRLPALDVEPFMPPLAQVRASLLFYYPLSPGTTKAPELYWQKTGTTLASMFDRRSRPNRGIRQEAAGITGGKRGEAELRRLFDWCRQHIHNLSNDALEDRPIDPAAFAEDRNAAAVFKSRSGTETEINLLFSSLARAAGFDVCLAATASRDWRLFDPDIKTSVFLDTWLVAVRLDDAWQLLDPGALIVPYAGLRWQHEGSSALLCIPQASEIVGTPVSTPDHSLRLRTAHLKLDDAGTLEGEVHTVLTGHRNAVRRFDEAGETPGKREKNRADQLRKRLAPGEISNVHVAQALPDTTLRYEEWFHLRIPDYAARAGNRLLLQPSVFEKDQPPLLRASERKYPVCFEFPWTDLDSIYIDLPAGLVMSDVEQPKPIDIPGVGQYAAMTHFDPGAHELVYVRVLRFGDNGTVCFPLDSYAALKGALESIHRRDGATLVIQSAGGSGP